ncbi:tetratricopeptide repeat protein [Streptomyces atratus]|uniref:tetratricopeptide repeat protein n=1 Tax=Streptomyces atratus TaxID=1893 RepID=UPI0034082590
MSEGGGDRELTVHGRASEQGRVYQATRDQYVTEHHHHYAPGEPSSLFGPTMRRTVVRVQSSPEPQFWPAPDSVRTPLVGRTPAVLRDRTDLMRRLTEATESETGGVHVLHGLGGCGKTAVAHAVFNLVVRRGQRLGLWVNASERSTLRAGMLAVAADRGAESVELAAAHDGQRASADLVWHYLHHSSQPWVLVLDNADDPAALGEGSWLRPSSQGTVIVTTRQVGSHVWNGAELHSVDVLPVKDAAEVLRDLAPRAGTAAEAETVARRLDCLPLALTLAGSFLSHQLLERWSMNDYRQHLDDNPTELIDRGAASGDSEKNARGLVGRTWEISLTALAGDGSPECLTLLRLLSCWGSDPLPLSLILPEAVDATNLNSADPPLLGQRVEVALRGLLNHSMVALVDSEESGEAVRCVKAHGVLLDSVAAAAPDDQRQLLVASAGILLDREAPEKIDGATSVGRVRRLVPHAAKLLRRVQDTSIAPGVVDVATRLAGLVFDSGDYPAALFLAQTASETAEHLLGPDHPATLRARHRAAMALFRLGRFAESEALHRQVLDARERVLGPEDRETLKSRQDIHEPLGQLNRLEECVATLRQTEEIHTRTLGDTHPDTLHVRALLIEYLATSDEVEEFDRIGPTTVSTCEQILGSGSFTTVTARHNFAYGLFRFRRWEQAEAVSRRALSDRRSLHGADHPWTLSAMVLLSWILGERGLLAESISFARQVVAGQERSFGPEHPYLLANRTGLATSLAAAGDLAESQDLALYNLPLCERVLGEGDPVTVRTRGLLDGQ